MFERLRYVSQGEGGTEEAGTSRGGRRLDLDRDHSKQEQGDDRDGVRLERRDSSKVLGERYSWGDGGRGGDGPDSSTRHSSQTKRAAATSRDQQRRQEHQEKQQQQRERRDDVDDELLRSSLRALRCRMAQLKRPRLTLESVRCLVPKLDDEAKVRLPIEGMVSGAAAKLCTVSLKQGLALLCDL